MKPHTIRCPLPVDPNEDNPITSANVVRKVTSKSSGAARESDEQRRKLIYGEAVSIEESCYANMRCAMYQGVREMRGEGKPAC